MNLKIKESAFMLILFIVTRFSFSRFIVIIIFIISSSSSSSSSSSIVMWFSTCQRVLEITITLLAAWKFFFLDTGETH